MSLLARSIADCVVRQSAVADDLPPETVYSFPASFVGFRGHFPGNPILPGVCILQAALDMVQRWCGQPPSLREVSQAKFFSSVGPDQELALRVTRAAAADGEMHLAVSARTTKKVAELALRVTLASPPKP